MSSKTEKEPLEVIEIKIDPETVTYSMTLSNAYVEDVYIVLREIVHSFENGELADSFDLEDNERGTKAGRERFIEVVQRVKERADEVFTTNSIDKIIAGGSFRD